MLETWFLNFITEQRLSPTHGLLECHVLKYLPCQTDCIPVPDDFVKTPVQASAQERDNSWSHGCEHI